MCKLIALIPTAIKCLYLLYLPFILEIIFHQPSTILLLEPAYSSSYQYIAALPSSLHGHCIYFYSHHRLPFSDRWPAKCFVCFSPLAKSQLYKPQIVNISTKPKVSRVIYKQTVTCSIPHLYLWTILPGTPPATHDKLFVNVHITRLSCLWAFIWVSVPESYIHIIST